MGIPTDGPMNMFYDKKAIVRNSTMPESSLKKKAFLLSAISMYEKRVHWACFKLPRGWSYKSSWFIDKEFPWSMTTRFNWMDIPQS